MTTRTFLSGLLLMLSVAVAAFAQAEQHGSRPEPGGPAITVSISAQGVRFVAPGGVRQMRVEVFNAGGDPVYNSDFQAGNVRDWTLRGKPGQRLADGAYLCVVTVRDLSGRLAVKQGTVLLQGGQASLQLAEGQQVGQVEPEKELNVVSDASPAAMTVTAHDGQEGQVTSTSGGLTFRTGDVFSGAEREHMRITPEGRIGVGTDKPEATLDVAGTIRARGGVVFEDGTVLMSAGKGGKASSSSGKADAAADGSGPNVAAISGNGTTGKITKWSDGPGGVVADSIITENTGKVGIGATTPINILEVRKDQAYSGTLASMTQLVVRNDSPTGFSAISIWGNGSERGRYQYNSASPNIFLTSIGQIPFYFGTNDSVRMSIDGTTGNVGVGLGFAAATAKLDVAGDLKVSGNAVVAGNIAAKYQDVAEWVRARQKITPGTVVILDTTLNNAVAPSMRPYDTHVAGVVSAQPGVILGEGGEGKVLVATTGRVKIKVDATRRPIKIGDLLVTSGKSGLAMKSLPIKVAGASLHRPGTIIGKALEPLAKGRGEILVLLSLQ